MVAKGSPTLVLGASTQALMMASLVLLSLTIFWNSIQVSTRIAMSVDQAVLQLPASSKTRSTRNTVPTRQSTSSFLTLEQVEALIRPGDSWNNNQMKSAILGQGQFCVQWDHVVDDWWTHNTGWDVVEESDEGICFADSSITAASTSSSTRRLEFLQRLYTLQFGGNSCANVYSRHQWNVGFGYEINNIIKGFTYGLQQQRPFVFGRGTNAQPWRYAAMEDGSKSVCPAMDFSCYFLPFSNCPWVQGNASEGIQNYVPVSDERMWMTEYAMRPKQWVRKGVYDYLHRQGFRRLSTPCVVMHVRRSDAVLEGNGHARQYFAIEDYLTRLVEHASNSSSSSIGQPSNYDLNKIRSILLLTDDQNAIEEAQLFHPQYQWNFLNRTRHRGTSGGYQNHVPSGDPVEEMVAMLASLRLAQQCDVIVRGTSTFGDLLSIFMRMRAQSDNSPFWDLSVEERGAKVRGWENFNNTKTLAKRLEEKKRQLEHE
ncbi:hypothetical protein IV203_032654 [Nitzschia inconspicua]|uniref:Uncharacterized protein n=1 Tax=Nitzschia inconspicua TaxID=303405 RepID=A0A9K3KLS7_9STRA|nr:hypothetical protein IV203_032654 [Nitzschia inconspicua]